MANAKASTRSHELIAVAPRGQRVRSPVTSGAPKPNSIVKSTVGPTAPQRRLQMIAEAAYFIAEHRGFAPGHDMEDWLAAEGEVDLMLSSETPADGA